MKPFCAERKLSLRSNFQTKCPEVVLEFFPGRPDDEDRLQERSVSVPVLDIEAIANKVEAMGWGSLHVSREWALPAPFGVPADLVQCHTEPHSFFE